jgi:hypothetical protein
MWKRGREKRFMTSDFAATHGWINGHNNRNKNEKRAREMTERENKLQTLQ